MLFKISSAKSIKNGDVFINHIYAFSIKFYIYYYFIWNCMLCNPFLDENWQRIFNSNIHILQDN